MTPLEQDIASWNEREQRFSKLFGQEALADKGFLKIKHAELRRIYRKHLRGSNTLEDKATLSMLRAGNRNMEKKLYPNRFVRYARRFGRFLGRSFRNIRAGIINRREQRRQRQQEWNNPDVIFSNNGKISMGQSNGQQVSTLEKQTPVEKQEAISLLPRNQNRQRVPEQEQKQGMSL